MRRWLMLVLATLALGLLGIAFVCHQLRIPQPAAHVPPVGFGDLRKLQEAATVGDVVDSWRGIPVRANGIPYNRSHGRHVGPDGYYYGRKWQCVEFVKRFYYDRHAHVFPDGMGHAKSFFDPDIPHGSLNPTRGLIQFINGYGEAPRVDDLLVWTEGTYGHVAVVSKAGGHFIEVVQQNVKEGSRMRLHLAPEGEGYRISGWGVPAGFLRLRELAYARAFVGKKDMSGSMDSH
jgi:hypothetical protein